MIEIKLKLCIYNVMRKIIILLSIIVMFAGCATTVSVVNTAPPKGGEPRVNRVAVFPLTDDRGDYISTSLANVLNQLEYKGSRAYTVLDRKIIENILKEQQFQMTVADPDTIIEFGRLAGVEGGFTGGVRYSGSERTVQEQRTRTETYTAIVNEYRPGVGNVAVAKEQKRQVPYYVNCSEGSYSMAVSLSLTDYVTTQVIYAGSFSRAISTKKCPDTSMSTQKSGFDTGKSALGKEVIELKNLSTATDTYTVMANDILAQVAKEFGEYTLIMDIEVAEKDNNLNKSDKDAFKNAVGYMEKGNTARACEIWRDMEGRNANAPYLFYNLGLCSEIAGDYDGAASYYNKADRLTGKPDKMIGKAIDRVATKRAEGIH